MAALFGIAIAGLQVRSGGDAMNDAFYTEALDSPIKLDVEPIAIRPVESVKMPPKAAVAPEVAAFPRRYENEQLNSRLSHSLPDGPWKVRLQVDLDERLRTVQLLQVDNRIVVQQETGWQLFDREGHSLNMRNLGRSDVTLDPARSLLYFVDEMGLFSACRMLDGERVFTTTLLLGNNFRRTFTARSDRRMLVVGSEVQQGPHAREKPNLSTIEVLDLGDPVQVGENRILLSASRPAQLLRKTLLLLTAIHDKTLILATQDRVYLADWSLRIKRILSGQFTPVALSLDELGRIYMVVRQEDKQAFWLLTPDGELLINRDISATTKELLCPPIVGYDHTAYLVSKGGVVAVGGDGALKWERPLNRVAGAVVTADDQLIVSADTHLIAFNSEGEGRLLSSFAPDILKTPPILTANHEMLVASASRLYGLVRDEQK
jgi:hypothetical protein